MAGADLGFTLTLNPNFGWEVARDALVASIPLAGCSVILHRSGRQGPWPLMPWVLALLLGPLYHFGLSVLVGAQIGAPPFPFLMAGYAWDEGAYAALFVTILWLAMFGLKPRRQVS